MLPSPLIKQRGLIMYRAEPEASHEASNIIRNRSRYPSHCCNHDAVVAINSDRASCRRYSHRSVQEFPQPDRSKSFRIITLLTWVFASLKRGSDCPRPSWQHKPTSVNRRALVVTADHGEAHTRPQAIERHRDTVLIALENTKSLRLCFHGFADVGHPSADLPHFRRGAVSQQFFV